MKRRWAIAWLLTVLFASCLCFSGCAVQKEEAGVESQGKEEKQDSEGPSADDRKTEKQETSVEAAGISFPYELEDGRLSVNSFFQSETINPDCGNEMGEETATMEITNQSGEFLEAAEITAVLADGTEIPFTVTNLPAGKTVWVFAADNAAIEQKAVCSTIECEAVFGETASLLEGQVSFEVQDTSIQLTNLTDKELTNLAVGCHCLFDDKYFGGITYTYPIEAIPAGESVTVEAADCYLGSAEVVCITREE